MARSRASRGKRIILNLDQLKVLGQNQGLDDAFLDYFETNLKAFANDFSRATKNAAKRLGVRNTGELISSIHGRAVTFQDGDAKVGIKFLEYGIYQNLGVGRGLTSIERSTGQALTSSRAAAGLSGRTAKPFLDQTEGIYHAKLQDFIGTKAVTFLETILANSLKQQIVIEL